MRVVVMEDYGRAVEGLDAFRLLDGHEVVVHSEHPATLDERAAQIGDAEALVLIRERTQVGEALLERLPHLRLICQTGRGMPHVDLDACTRHGVVVCNGGGSPHAPAELTLALILSATRHVATDALALRQGQWQTTIGRELHGRVLGIAGYGAIGALVARYGRAIGMDVLAWGREGSAARARADGVEIAGSLDGLCERSDVLSLHLKLAPETEGVLDGRRLGLMQPDALLVNTARAGLIVPGALAEALAAGRPGAAAIDVFDDEPALGDPLVHDARVLATPHLGYVTRETYERYFAAAFAQVNAFAAGAPSNVVNPVALGSAG